ncbi:MAG: hypothetical protein ACYST6_17455 [Planctomycetota bacterium]|jgi:hypothetical protein
MGTFLHRTTKRYLQSADPNELPEDISNYISEPDLSAVVGVPRRYWAITGDTVSEMGQSEKDAVDAAMLSDRRDGMVAELDSAEGTLRQLVRMLISEINILRAEHGLPDRTMAQFKTQIRNGYGS